MSKAKEGNAKDTSYTLQETSSSSDEQLEEQSDGVSMFFVGLSFNSLSAEHLRSIDTSFIQITRRKYTRHNAAVNAAGM